MRNKQRCSETQKGRIVINKDNKEKRVYEDQLAEFLVDGWKKGMSEAHREARSKAPSHPAWNKGLKGVMKRTKTTWSSGHIPWNKGKKLKPSWNKGLTKEISPGVARGAEKKLNHPVSEEARRKMSEAKKNSSSWAKGLTKETDPIIARIAQAIIGKHLSDKTKAKISATKKGKRLTKEQLEIKISKQYITRKANNTFNTSQPENDLYKFLLEENKNKTIYRQYKDPERYPFYCDFYIVEDDLFIELNAHWTHGGKPYNPDDSECQERLKEWQEKAKVSKFYKAAIETWTVRDVKKINYAKKNNLNYKTIY